MFLFFYRLLMLQKNFIILYKTIIMKNLILNPQIINEFLPYLKQAETGEDLNEKFQFSLSVGLFMSKVVSLERAANLAGKTINEFIELLIEKNIIWHNYLSESDELDKLAIKKYKILNKND